MKNKKIILISFSGDIFNFSLNSIANYAKKYENRVEIIHCNPSDKDTDFVFGLFTKEQLKAIAMQCEDAKIIGISLVAVHYLKMAEQITNYLSKIYNIPIIWGGVPIITDPNYYLDYTKYISIAEGEKLIVEMSKAIDLEKDISTINGLGFKNTDGDIIKNPQFPAIDVNEVSIKPDFNIHYFLIDNTFICLKDNINLVLEKVQKKGYRVFPIRGCPFMCSFCANNQLSKVFSEQKTLRKVNLDLVISELEFAKDNFPNLNLIMSYEDDFFARNEDELYQFAKLYKERINLPININGTIKLITTSKIDILLQGGIVFDFIKIGLQSASKRINKQIYKRPFSRKEYISKIPMLIDKKIRVIVDVISSNPYETKEDKLEALSFYIDLATEIIKTSKEPWKFIQIMDHKLMYYPGTELYAKAISDGTISKTYINDILLKRTTAIDYNDVNIDTVMIRFFYFSLKYNFLINILKLSNSKYSFFILNNFITKSSLKFLLYAIKNKFIKSILKKFI
ncbi:B12-binding domain-containing radical SAM protein [Sulfurimonas sp.]